MKHLLCWTEKEMKKMKWNYEGVGPQQPVIHGDQYTDTWCSLSCVFLALVSSYWKLKLHFLVISVLHSQTITAETQHLMIQSGSDTLVRGCNFTLHCLYMKYYL